MIRSRSWPARGARRRADLVRDRVVTMLYLYFVEVRKQTGKLKTRPRPCLEPNGCCLEMLVNLIFLWPVPYGLPSTRKLEHTNNMSYDFVVILARKYPLSLMDSKRVELLFSGCYIWFQMHLPKYGNIHIHIFAAIQTQRISWASEKQIQGDQDPESTWTTQFKNSSIGLNMYDSKLAKT